MKRFLSILKATYYSSLSISFSKRQKKMRSPFIPQLISGIILVFYFAFLFYESASNIGKLNISNQSIFEYVDIYFTCIIFFGLFMSIAISPSIYFYKGDEAFLPLPIKGRELFLAKYLINIYYSFIYGGTSLLALSIITCISFNLPFYCYILGILASIIETLLLSFISFIVALFFSTFIHFKTSKVALSLYSTIFALIGVLGFIFSIFFSIEGNDIASIENSIHTIYSNLTFINWIAYIPSKVILVNSPIDLQFVGYGLIVLVVTGIITFLLADKFYLTRLYSTSSHHKKKKTSHIDKVFSLAMKHPFLFFIRREFYSLSRNSQLFISSLIYSIIMLISGISLLSFFAFSQELALPKNILFIVVFALVLTASLQPYLSYISLPLEGKSFYLIKTMPFKSSSYIFSKIVFGFIYTGLINIILFSVFLPLLSFDIYTIILSIPFSIVYSFSSNLLYLLISIFFSHFDYNNPIEILQKGWGNAIVIIANYLFPALSLITIITFSLFLPNMLYLAVIIDIVFYLGIDILLYFLVKKSFSHLLNKDVTI